MQRATRRQEDELARAGVRDHQVRVLDERHAVGTLTRVHHRDQLASRTELLQPGGGGRYRTTRTIVTSMS